MEKTARKELVYAASDFAVAYRKLHRLLSEADDGSDRWHELVFTRYPFNDDFDETIFDVYEWVLHIMDYAEEVFK